MSQQSPAPFRRPILPTDICHGEQAIIVHRQDGNRPCHTFVNTLQASFTVIGTAI